MPVLEDELTRQKAEYDQFVGHLEHCIDKLVMDGKRSSADRKIEQNLCEKLMKDRDRRIKEKDKRSNGQYLESTARY